MKLSSYHDIIFKTITTDIPGYGYTDVFMNTLFLHREELNIGNALLFLRIGINGQRHEWLSFADNRKIRFVR